MMKEKPILFNGEMVRAVLDGKKTQTRRVVKNPPKMIGSAGDILLCTEDSFRKYKGHITQLFPSPYGEPGGQLWVRERWLTLKSLDHVSPSKIAPGAPVLYHADQWNDGFPYGFDKGKGRPSIFMMRWMSRITLEVVSVRVERLQDITEEDAIAEGVRKFLTDDEEDCYYAITRNQTPCADYAVDVFSMLWDSINEKRGFGWESNPWVWVVEFRRVTDGAGEPPAVRCGGEV